MTTLHRFSQITWGWAQYRFGLARSLCGRFVCWSPGQFGYINLAHHHHNKLYRSRLGAVDASGTPIMVNLQYLPPPVFFMPSNWIGGIPLFYSTVCTFINGACQVKESRPANSLSEAMKLCDERAFRLPLNRKDWEGYVFDCSQEKQVMILRPGLSWEPSNVCLR